MLHFLERRLAYLKRDPHLLFEIDHVRDDNARVICEVSANRIQIGDVDVVLALYRDLSERRKMQEQLLLSQKMESIGTLSCGIAHDFRNVLATVQTFCDFIRTIKQDGPYCPAHESVVSSADLMEGELLRASEMLRKLLSFGGKTALEMSPVDVNAAVDDVVGLYSKVSKAVRFHIAVDNSVPLVNADRGSIDQALMNLIVNAAEATPKGGTVTVKTSVRFLRADEYRPASYSMENGLKKFIEIEISDTGIGIRPDVLAHIFEPFYTTKTNSPRSGTGLGLAIVYFVVKEHGGVVKVESKVGVGTTFRVYLPVSGSPEDMLAALPGDSNKGREERRGRVQG
jgi:signal transduction histidine kinase